MRRLVLSIALVACQAPAAPHVAVHAAPWSSAPKKDRCSPLLEDNASSLATWSDALGKIEKSSRAKLESLLQFCAPGKDGVWSLAVDDVRSGNADDPEAVLVRLALRYRFDDGRETKAVPTVRRDADVNLTIATGREPFDFDEPKNVDYDGDGMPEIIVHLTRGGMGEDSGDDRYSVAVAPRFRPDDAVAIAWAKKQCAEVVGAPLAEIDSGEQGFRWAACQRMSGRSEAELEAAYAKRCPPASDPPACDESLCASEIPFERAASVKPPLVFAR